MVQTIQAFLCKVITTVVAFLLIVFLMGMQVGYGQTTLLEYFNVEGTETSVLVQPTNVEAGLDGTNLSISSGSISTGNSHATTWQRPLDYAQSNGGWNVDTKVDAKNFNFAINLAGAESFTLSELSFEERATGAGPSVMTVTINGVEVFADSVHADDTRLHNIDLTSGYGADFEDISEAIVRIKGWDNSSRSTSGGGDWRINGIIVEGEVNIGSPVTIPYTQNFSDFVFEENSVIESFGHKSEWRLISEGDVLEYKGDWGSGSSAGFRGNANVLGYQHTGSTGMFTARLALRNETGSTIDVLSISYDGRVERDDQGRSPEWAVSVNDSIITSLSFSTVEGIDKTVRHTVEGLHIQDGEFIYIEWKSERGDGSNHSKQIGIGNVSVTLEGQYAVSITGTEGFRMLSTPVETTFEDFLSPIYTQGATVGANTENGDPNVFTWDNNSEGTSNENWTGLDNLSSTIAAGSGFLVYVFQDDEFDVDGSFPKTLSVSGAENSEVTVDANPYENGWALLGNPFTSPIDFNELAKTNLTDNVYVWDVNNEGGTTQESAGSGSWQSYSVGATTGDLPDGIIAPFQGFFVQTDEAGGSSVGFTEGAKTTGGSFMGKEVSRNVVRLELNGQGMRNSAWLSFSENGSMGQVYGDAHQLQPLSSNYALLAAKKTDGLFDISVLPSPDSSFELPLEADATFPGSYTLRVTDFSASFDETLYLEDRQEGISVELNDSMEYEFTLDGHAQKAVPNPQSLLANGPVIAAKRSSDASRFYITSQAAVSIDAPDELPQKLSLSQNFPNPFNPVTVINFDIPRQSHVRLAVYDQLGRQVDVLVNDTRERGTYDVTWDASRFSSGVYFYHLETDGQALTRRMTLIK